MPFAGYRCKVHTVVTARGQKEMRALRDKGKKLLEGGGGGPGMGTRLAGTVRVG